MSPGRGGVAVGMALGLALAGCATVAPIAPPIPATAAPKAAPICDAVAVLAFFDAAPPESSLEKEIQDAARAFSETGDACDRFRLVSRLLVPDPKLRDEGRALKLLDEFLELGPQPNGLTSLASLLAGGIRRQWGLEERQKELARKLTEERAKAEAMKRQLEELKEIERIIDQRQKQ